MGRSILKRVWSSWVGIVGIGNAVAFVPQIWNIWMKHEAQGVSMTMFVVFLAAQLTWMTESYIKRSYAMTASMAVAALFSTSIIVGTWLYT